MMNKTKIVISLLAAVVLIASIACFVLAGCFRKVPEAPVVSEPEVIVDSSDIVEIDPVENDPVVSEPVVSKPAASEPVESEAPDAKDETTSKTETGKKDNASSTAPTPPKKTEGEELVRGKPGVRPEDAQVGDWVKDPFTGEWVQVQEGLPGGGDITGTTGGEYLGA